MGMVAFLIIWLLLTAVGTWAACAYFDAKGRANTGTRYISFRELGVERAVTNRIFDWYNETADKIVAKRGF